MSKAKVEFWKEIRDLDLKLHRNAYKAGESNVGAFSVVSSGGWKKTEVGLGATPFVYAWRGKRRNLVLDASGLLMIIDQVRGGDLRPDIVDYRLPLKGTSFNYDFFLDCPTVLSGLYKREVFFDGVDQSIPASNTGVERIRPLGPQDYNLFREAMGLIALDNFREPPPDRQTEDNR